MEFVHISITIFWYTGNDYNQIPAICKQNLFDAIYFGVERSIIMTGENENDYRFVAEEEHRAGSGQAQSADTTLLAGSSCAPDTDQNPCNTEDRMEDDPVSASVSGIELFSKREASKTVLENMAADIKETATEQPSEVPTLSITTPSAHVVRPETAYTYEIPAPQNANQNSKKKSRIGSFLRRGTALLAAAALFGGVAAGAFIGFNELYYRLNPSAKPSLSDSPDGNGSGRTPLLSHTTVASGTSVATSDVSVIVREAMPSLVSISCTFRNTTSFFGYLYEGTSEGAGSGIIVGKNDKELLIATNNHVVDDAVTTTVTFQNGSQADGFVRGTEEAADLAIVSVPLSELSAETLADIAVAELGDSDKAQVGQMVIAIGNALGYGQTTTVGYLSAKEREITVSDSTTGKSTKYTALQVDAAINPGNSGGALINTDGKVIGINSAKLSSTKVEGIGYAIPINDAIDILKELMDREILTEEEQGYLGVYLSDQEITEEISKLYGFPRGVFIADVVKGGAADKAGIVSGDIITAINGSAVTARTQLQEKVKAHRSGTEITVTLARLENGQYRERDVTVLLGSKADFE